MIKYLIIIFLCIGCAGFKADTIYTEQKTIDDHTWFMEYGVSGKLSDKVRLDLFVSPTLGITDHTDDKITMENLGGGIRLFYYFGK